MLISSLYPLVSKITNILLVEREKGSAKEKGDNPRVRVVRARARPRPPHTPVKTSIEPCLMIAQRGENLATIDLESLDGLE